MRTPTLFSVTMLALIAGGASIGADPTKPTTVGDERITRWEIVVDTRIIGFPRSEPGYSSEGSRTLRRHEGIFEIHLKKKTLRGEWRGEIKGSGGATGSCWHGAWWEYKRGASINSRKECPSVTQNTDTALTISGDIRVDENRTEPPEVEVLLRSDRSGDKKRAEISCEVENELYPGGRFERGTVTKKEYCDYPGTQRVRIPLREGTHVIYEDRDARGELVTEVRLRKLDAVVCQGDCATQSACLQGVCDEILGCIYKGLQGPCQPANKCRTGWCNRYSGRCIEDEKISCDDSNACTVDDCDELVGCVHESRICRDTLLCTKDLCDPLLGCRFEPLNGQFNFYPHDCYKDECQNGYLVKTPDDNEVLPQASPHDCEKQVCMAGSRVTIGDATGIPEQIPHNCRKEECGLYGVMYRVDNADVPVQSSPHDCLKQVCQLGEPISVPNDSETPLPAADGTPHICQDGEPVLAP